MVQCYTSISAGSTTQVQKEARFPSAGIITNILIMGRVQRETEFKINFGPRVPVLTLTGSNPSALQVKPGRAPKNGFQLTAYLTNPEEQSGEVIDTTELVEYVAFDKREFTVTKGSTWYLSAIYAASNSENQVWLQYDFIPYDRAHIQDSWRVGALAEAANYQNQYQFLTSMKNVKLEIEAFLAEDTTGASAQVNALLVIKLLKSGSDVPDELGAYVNENHGRSSTTIAEILLNSEGAHEEIAYVPYVAAGDRLAYDMIIYDGAEAESSLNIEIDGYQNGKEKATFRRYTSPSVVDLSEALV